MNEEAKPLIPELILYKRRWLMLLLFSLLTFSNGVQWISFAPRPELFMKYYHISSDLLYNALSMSFMFLFPIFLYPALYIEMKYPENAMRLAMMVGSLLNALGALLKWISVYEHSFGWLMTGQCLASISQVFFLSLPPKLASVWFGRGERNTTASVGVLSNYIGIATGFLSSFWVRTENDILPFMICQFLVCTGIFVGVMFFFQEKPQTPASFSSAIELEKIQLSSWWSQSRKLFSSSSFVGLLISFSFVSALQYALSTVISELYVPLFPEFEPYIGLLGFLQVLAGIVSSFLIGYWLDRYHHYHNIFIGFHIGTFICSLFLYLHLKFMTKPDTTQFIISSIFFILSGFFNSGVVPISFQYSSQLFFPHSEVLTTSLMNGGANIFGVLLIFLMGLFPSKEPFTMETGMWIYGIFQAVGFVFSLLVNGKLYRDFHDYSVDEEDVYFT